MTGHHIAWINTSPGIMVSDIFGTFEIRFYPKQQKTPFVLKCPSNGRFQGFDSLHEAKFEAEIWYAELLEMGMLPDRQ